MAFKLFVHLKKIKIKIVHVVAEVNVVVEQHLFTQNEIRKRKNIPAGRNRLHPASTRLV